ncbi:MAG: asparagine synthase (glutamine-hydrolyzing) [Candidatus Didemnitutus sp.]|nr:asparagine synthase (glutamine-hydrolyzing) [Candidatus Didemnitutus sp.]
MCGIVGFCGPVGDAAVLGRMMDRLAHRGPDGRGTFARPDLGLFIGHLRLAILDLVGGAQPMWNEDGAIGIVFNGEIYNHAELRAELVARGHRFASDHSDTEALVHGYEEWGEGLLPRLNGMFAFCIIDLRRGELFLARDRFGEKPLFYTRQRGVFAFASEASAFRCHPALRLEADDTSMQKFLACGWLASPRSFHRGVAKLPPGSSIAVPFGGEPMAPRSYWQFRVEPEAAWTRRSDRDLTEELAAQVERAVRRRLVADVPIGVFLSGGLDSSAITNAAAASVPRGRLETFTIGFEDGSYDERESAAAVAAHLGTEHHERVLTLGNAAELMSGVLARMDEPIADPSILPTYLLCRFARERVTVALSGDGGDELLAGYDTFSALGLAQVAARCLPRGMLRWLRAGAERWPASDRNMSFDFKVRRALGGLVRPPEMWNPAWIGPVAPELVRELVEHPLSPEELYEEPIALWRSRPDLSVEERTLEFYTRFYLTENILFKVDRAGMFNSLESRAVFLDNDLVDFCRRLPYAFKMRRGRTKWLLREALAQRVPSAILERPKKGFGVPVSKWLRALPPEKFDVPLPELRRPAARAMVARHQSGRADYRGALWGLLQLQALDASQHEREHRV